MSRVKLGLHTILWGRSPQDLKQVLEFIAETGFEGVEVFQHPRYLERQLGSTFGDLLEHLQLELVGLCSGTLKERIEFCKRFQLKPNYLYVDWIDPSIDEAVSEGFTVALHPHAFKLANPEVLLDYAASHPSVKLLVDPAHLHVMARDPIDWLVRACSLPVDEDGSNKVIGVHLKNWGSWYGRSFQRYAQGFCELSAGEVNLPKFLETLVANGDASTWAVVEQDRTDSTPRLCVFSAVRWLRENLHGNKLVELEPNFSNDVALAVSQSHLIDLTPTAEKVLDKVVRSHNTPIAFGDIVVELIRDWMDCKLVSLWEHSPSVERLTLVSSSTRGIPAPLLKVCDSLPGQVVDSKFPEFFPNIYNGQRKFGRPEIGKELGLVSLLSVPIWNSHNPNDVELVLNLYFDTGDLQQCIPLHELKRCPEGMDIEEFVRHLMSILADYIAIAFETALADRVMKASEDARSANVLTMNREDYLARCTGIARTVTNADCATLYWENKRQNNVAEIAHAGSQRTGSKSFTKGESNVGRVWQEGIETIELTENTRQSGSSTCIVSVPVTNGNHCIGVLSCQGKVAEYAFAGPSMFTQSDVTVLQAICDAIVPRIRLFEADDRILNLFRQMAHELKAPTNGINAHLDFIEIESRQAGVVFSEPWVQEARESVDLLVGLVNSAEQIAMGIDGALTPERAQKLYIMKDIIAPVRDQMKALLRKKGIGLNSIQLKEPESRQSVTETWSCIPRIFLRKYSIHQVFFNLLTNAIKYAWKDRRQQLAVDVIPSSSENYYQVHVRDWGIGIDEEDAENVFDIGFRCDKAIEYDVTGYGFGLHIAREIMRNHGGDLKLTSNRFPTEFTVEFPRSLAYKPPEN